MPKKTAITVRRFADAAAFALRERREAEAREYSPTLMAATHVLAMFEAAREIIYQAIEDRAHPGGGYASRMFFEQVAKVLARFDPEQVRPADWPVRTDSILLLENQNWLGISALDVMWRVSKTVRIAIIIGQGVAGKLATAANDDRADRLPIDPASPDAIKWRTACFAELLGQGAANLNGMAAHRIHAAFGKLMLDFAMEKQQGRRREAATPAIRSGINLVPSELLDSERAKEVLQEMILLGGIGPTRGIAYAEAWRKRDPHTAADGHVAALLKKLGLIEGRRGRGAKIFVTEEGVRVAHILNLQS